MLDFGLKLSHSAETVGESDFDALKSHGFDEADIGDIAGTAFFRAAKPYGERDLDARQRSILHYVRS